MFELRSPGLSSRLGAKPNCCLIEINAEPGCVRMADSLSMKYSCTGLTGALIYVILILNVSACGVLSLSC